LKLGQLYYLIKQPKPANEYFELAIKNSKQESQDEMLLDILKGIEMIFEG